MVDYASMYAACYATFGVDVVVTLADSNETELEFVAIDITGGIDLGGIFANARNRFASELNTIVPAISVMRSSLVDYTDLAELDGADVLVNGKHWKVRGNAPKPAPTGEASGEVYLFLTEQG